MGSVTVTPGGMRRVVVCKSTGGRGQMIQSKNVWVSGQMAVLEESVGTAVDTTQVHSRAKSQSSWLPFPGENGWTLSLILVHSGASGI